MNVQATEGKTVLRSRTLAAAVVIASASLAAAGCGSTSTTTTKTAAAQAQTTSAPVQSAQQAGTGYYNMNALSVDLAGQIRLRLSKAGSTATVATPDCFLTGPQAATCHLTASDGSTTTIAVNISADGSNYTTPGSYTPGP